LRLPGQTQGHRGREAKSLKEHAVSTSQNTLETISTMRGSGLLLRKLTNAPILPVAIF
jgi:hypothetical protein